MTVKYFIYKHDQNLDKQSQASVFILFMTDKNEIFAIVDKKFQADNNLFVLPELDFPLEDDEDELDELEDHEEEEERDDDSLRS